MLQKFNAMYLDGAGESARFKVRPVSYGDPVSLDITEQGPGFECIATTLYFDNPETVERMILALEMVRNYLAEGQKFGEKNESNLS